MGADLRRRRRAGGNIRGLWIEPAATNYVPNNTTSPAGGTGGKPFGASAYGILTGNVSTLSWTALAATLTAINCVSILWKNNGSTGYTLLGRDTTAGIVRAQVNWTVNADGSPNLAAPSFGVAAGSYAVPSLGSGVYRIYVYGNAWSVAAGQLVQAEFSSTAGVGGAYVALPQIEQGTFPTSPIPNVTGAAITRSADVFITPSQSNQWLGTTGTILEDSINLMRGVDTLLNRWLVNGYKTPGTAADQIDYIFVDSATDRLGMVTTGAVVGVAAAGALHNRSDIAGVRHVKTLRVNGGSFLGHTNGAQFITVADATANLDTLQRRLGTPQSAGSQAPGILFQLAAYQARINPAALVDSIDANGYGFPLTFPYSTYLDFRSSLPPSVTYSRASVAANDDLSIAAINAPRFSSIGV